MSQDGAYTPKLTKRQLEVIELVTKGLTNREIATELGLGLGTVKAHLTLAMGMMGARNRTDLASKFISLKEEDYDGNQNASPQNAELGQTQHGTDAENREA